MASRILVTGASGTIGSRLVERLRGADVPVRLAGRSPEALRRRWPPLDAVRLDALDPATIPAAMRDVDVLYYLIHSMGEGEAGFAERDRRAAANVAGAAAEAGVRRIVYLGGLGDPVDSLSEHLASRQEAGRVLAAHGPPVVELRAGIILGADSASFRMLWDLVDRLPVMVTPRWVDTRAQPIAIDDVIGYLDAARTVETAQRHLIVEIGGADVLSYKEMMQRLARIRGKRRRIVTVPVLTPRLSSLWCAFVTSVPLSVARPLIDGVRNEVVVRDDTARLLFPDIRPVGFEAAARAAMEEMHR
ncbi:MAG TPA: NAD(P)H-binding protein [Actinomycetota bacterium]